MRFGLLVPGLFLLCVGAAAGQPTPAPTAPDAAASPSSGSDSSNATHAPTGEAPPSTTSQPEAASPPPETSAAGSSEADAAGQHVEANADAQADASPAGDGRPPDVRTEASAEVEADTTVATNDGTVRWAAGEADRAAREAGGPVNPQAVQTLDSASHVRTSVDLGGAFVDGSLAIDHGLRIRLGRETLVDSSGASTARVLPGVANNEAPPGGPPVAHGPVVSPADAWAPSDGAVASDGVLHPLQLRGAVVEPELVLAWLTFVGGTVALGAAASAPSASLVPLQRAVRRLLRLFGAAALFSRLREAAVLGHPRRSALVEFVRMHPGERAEMARRSLGLPNGVWLHHLRVLVQRGLVRERREEGMCRLYPGGPRIAPRPYLRPFHRAVLDRLRSTPGLTQREIARTFGASERAVSYQVAQLQRQGLLRVERAGQSKRCFAAAVDDATPGIELTPALQSS